MDATIRNVSVLYDEVLAVLNKHRDEPGITEAATYLKAAKGNYAGRSIDHMMSCLVLAVYYLVSNPPRDELSRELRSAIQGYFAWINEAGSRLSQMAHQYEASGGKLLSNDEILREVDERRGVSGR